MGQSRISRHVKILADAGLVDSWKEGAWGLYYMVENGPGRQFIEAVRYLFEGDPLLENDLIRAARIVEERTQNTRRFFNTIADSWGRLKQQIIGDFDLNQVIFKDISNYDVAVDLGCGTGDLLESMKAHAKSVIGVDSAPGMLEAARKRYHNGNSDIDIRLGEIEHLPLSDNEVDLAVISLVLQYLDKPEDAITEVSRVIRPKGMFIIADFEKHTNQAFREKYGARWLGFDFREVTAWLADKNFETIAIDRYPLEQDLTLTVYRNRWHNL